MLSFQLSINEVKRVVAGHERLRVLSFNVIAVGKLGEHSNFPVREGAPAYDVHVSLGGLTESESELDDNGVHWLSEFSLKVGDRIKIRVVDCEECDPPSVVDNSRAKV